MSTAVSDGPTTSGASISERALNGAHDGEFDGETDEELFPLGSLEGDPAVTGKNFVSGSQPVKVTAKLKNVSVPAGGLVAAGTPVHLLVKAIAGGVDRCPTMEDDGQGGKRVTGWEERQRYEPAYVQEAQGMFSRADVIDILYRAGVPDEKVDGLLSSGR